MPHNADIKNIEDVKTLWSIRRYIHIHGPIYVKYYSFFNRNYHIQIKRQHFQILPNLILFKLDF